MNNIYYWLLPNGSISISILLQILEPDILKPDPQATYIQPNNAKDFIDYQQSHTWRYNPLTNNLYIDDTLANRDAWASVRIVRDKLLSDSDVILMRALENSIELAPIKKYRQTLRDITNAFQSPNEVIWPEKPSL